VYRGTILWMDGVPRQIYRGPSSPDLKFPVRGMFYYAWYVFDGCHNPPFVSNGPSTTSHVLLLES
jgi:hypothetical protein